MPLLEYIPKTLLIELMEDWGARRVTTEDVSFWCCNNYFPANQTWDPSLPSWQQLAVRDVLQAFEWQANDDRITARPENWFKAVELLNCSEDSYEEAKAAFECDCAGFE